VAYLLNGFIGVNSDFRNLDAETSALTDFGCQLANSIIAWIEVFLELSIIGFPLIYLSTLGNSIYARRNSRWTYLAFLVGIVTVLVYTVGFYSAEFHIKILDT
jgi:hypothetical protein